MGRYQSNLIGNSRTYFARSDIKSNRYFVKKILKIQYAVVLCCDTRSKFKAKLTERKKKIFF